MTKKKTVKPKKKPSVKKQSKRNAPLHLPLSFDQVVGALFQSDPQKPVVAPKSSD